MVIKVSCLQNPFTLYDNSLEIFAEEIFIIVKKSKLSCVINVTLRLLHKIETFLQSAIIVNKLIQTSIDDYWLCFSSLMLIIHKLLMFSDGKSLKGKSYILRPVFNPPSDDYDCSVASLISKRGRGYKEDFFWIVEEGSGWEVGF